MYFRNVASLSGNTLLIRFTFTISWYSYNLLLWRNKHFTFHHHFFLTYLQRKYLNISCNKNISIMFYFCVPARISKAVSSAIGYSELFGPHSILLLIVFWFLIRWGWENWQKFSSSKIKGVQTKHKNKNRLWK